MEATRRPMSVLFALCMALPAGAFAEAVPFRVRKAGLQDGKLVLYHEAPPAAAGGELSVRAGALECKPASGDVMRTDKGGDHITTLIVIDRGGTSTTGMGQYGAGLLNGVHAAVRRSLDASPGDKFALVDSAGLKATPGELEPTGDYNAFRSFIVERGKVPPAGSGADIYGLALQGLRLLDKAETRLGAVVLITDGVDPDESAVDKKLVRLLEGLRKRGLSLSAVHVDRSSEKGRSAAATKRGQRGRNHLVKLVDDSNGDLRTVVGHKDGDEARAKTLAADANPTCRSALCERLEQALLGLGRSYKGLARSVCTLCGQSAKEGDVVVTMKVTKDDKPVAISRAAPSPKVRLPARDFGDCGGKGEEKPAGKACSADADCGSCRACADGVCGSKTCTAAADCGGGDCTCDGGSCRARRSATDRLPMILGGVALLGLLLLGAGLWLRGRRKARTQQAELQQRLSKEKASREAESARVQAVQSRLADEAAAREREQATMRREYTDKVQALEQQLNPVLFRLVSPDGTYSFDLRAGDSFFGADGQAGNDHVIDATTVSGRHARVHVADHDVAIEDLGSSNGTFVNDYKLRPNFPVALQPGDQLALSRSIVLVLSEATSATRPSAPAGGGRSATVLDD